MADKGLLSLFSVGSMEEVHRSVAAKGEADLEALAAVLRLGSSIVEKEREKRQRQARCAEAEASAGDETGQHTKEGDEEDVGTTEPTVVPNDSSDSLSLTNDRASAATSTAGLGSPSSPTIDVRTSPAVATAVVQRSNNSDGSGGCQREEVGSLAEPESSSSSSGGQREEVSSLAEPESSTSSSGGGQGGGSGSSSSSGIGGSASTTAAPIQRSSSFKGKRKLESGSLGVGSIVWAKGTDDVVAIDDDNYYAATIEAVDNDAQNFVVTYADEALERKLKSWVVPKHTVPMGDVKEMGSLVGARIWSKNMTNFDHHETTKGALCYGYVQNNENRSYSVVFMCAKHLYDGAKVLHLEDEPRYYWDMRTLLAHLVPDGELDKNGQDVIAALAKSFEEAKSSPRKLRRTTSLSSSSSSSSAPLPSYTNAPAKKQRHPEPPPSSSGYACPRGGG